MAKALYGGLVINQCHHNIAVVGILSAVSINNIPIQYACIHHRHTFNTQGEHISAPCNIGRQRNVLLDIFGGKNRQACSNGANQWHMQYADVDMSPSFITITFDLAGEHPENLINRKFTIPQSAVPALQRMLRELDRMDDFSSDLVICMLQILLLELLREQVTPAGTKLRTTNAVNSENEIIRRAQQFISEHVREKLTVPLVARHVDVSPSYLTALFRKNLQISPGEYIRRIKLQESKQMIREDNMNFTEIAAALQYSTVHHFSRQFKDKFGITPTEYAKSVR